MTQPIPIHTKRKQDALSTPSDAVRIGIKLVLFMLSWVSVLGQDKAFLLVENVIASPTLAKKFVEQGKSNQLARCMESLETQLTHALSIAPAVRLLGDAELRKLRSDAPSSDRMSGFDLSEPSARVRLSKAGIKYVLKTRVTAFEDEVESKAQTQVQTQTYAHQQAEARVQTLEQQLSTTRGPRRRHAIQRQLVEARQKVVSQGTNSVFSQDKRSVIERRVALLANAQLFDSIGGEILNAVSFEVKTNAIDTTLAADSDKQDGREDLSRGAARSLATKLAAFAIDTIDPIRVLKVDKDTITLNRGEHSDLLPGQMFSVFTEGDVLKDPATGKDKGHEEHVVGRVRIMEVGSTLTKARIVEDKGLAIGARLKRSNR
jgi:hypothetical protein